MPITRRSRTSNVAPRAPEVKFNQIFPKGTFGAAVGHCPARISGHLPEAHSERHSITDIFTFFLRLVSPPLCECGLVSISLPESWQGVGLVIARKQLPEEIGGETKEAVCDGIQEPQWCIET